MTRAAQNLLMLLVGGAVLWITLVTGEVTNYVKPGLRYPLVGCAAVLIVLGAAGLRRDWADRHEHDGHDGHDHHHSPRVAWLLLLPVFVIFAVAPPELGVFTATRADTRPAPPPPAVPSGDEYALPVGLDPYPLPIGEFMGRAFEAQVGGAATLAGRRLSLTGFATPAKGGRWHLNRLQLSCCAADAITLRVTVLGAPAPAKGAWVTVVGTWKPGGTPKSDPVYELKAASVTPAKKPENPYE